jgi:hypothetical protein
MKQTRRFQTIITNADKKGMRELAKSQGKHYGVFFDTSGKVRMEQINPTAQYDYLFRTDAKG